MKNCRAAMCRQSGSNIANRITLLLLVVCAGLGARATVAQESAGLRGDPEAISLAQAMVETMGGMTIWRDLGSVHFVHEWDIATLTERYLENEILDLTAPRAYVTMESETYQRIRAYSPEYRYWNIVNGEFAYADDAALENALERAPYSIYRLARMIARGDDRYELQLGELPDVPGVEAIEFRDSNGVPHGWIALNRRHEPILWATTQYMYTLGPLKRFGNLWVPNWATANDGLVRYEMVSLKGSIEPPDLSLFAVPPDYQ